MGSRGKPGRFGAGHALASREQALLLPAEGLVAGQQCAHGWPLTAIPNSQSYMSLLPPPPPRLGPPGRPLEQQRLRPGHQVRARRQLRPGTRHNNGPSSPSTAPEEMKHLPLFGCPHWMPQPPPCCLPVPTARCWLCSSQSASTCTSPPLSGQAVPILPSVT